MTEMNNDFNKKQKNEKTDTDNQWVSTGIKIHDNRERRDGPGGEDSSNK